MALPFLSTHLAAPLLSPAPSTDVEIGAPGGSTPADDAITSLTLQDLSTIAGGWGQIDPI